MIELVQYNCLSKEKKTALLHSEGVYLCSRQEPEFIVDLYQLHEFYVEVFYHERINELIDLVSFKSNDPLKAYFNKIDVSKFLASPVSES